MFSAKPVVPVTVSLWDGYRPGGNDDGDDDWRPNNKYFEFDNPSAFKDGNNQINTFTPPDPFYLHDDWVYFVVIESDGSGSTEYYITNTDADGQSRVDSDWWILNSAVRYQDPSNSDDPWPDTVTQTPTRIPVFTIHAYDLDRLTYTTSESDQDNFAVGEDNYNWWAQSFNAIRGADSFIGFKLHSVALDLEYLTNSDSGIPDSPDEISVSLYTGKQEGGDWVPDEKLFDFRDPPAFREGQDNAFTAPEGTTLRPQGRYAIVIRRHGGGWIRLRNTASNDQDGNSNLFVDNESQKSRDGTNWSDENWVVKMLVYGKQRTEAIPLSTGATLSGLSLGTGVTLSPAFASGTVTYTASVANSVDEVTVTPTTNHASATVEILDTDDNALDDADDMEDDFQVALSVGDTVIKVKVTADGTSTYTVTVTRDDFPNDNTTTGEVEVGGSVTGNVDRDADVDWFRVELEADTRYQIDVEGADTGRGTLENPAASMLDAVGTSLSVADDDSGVGENGRVIYTPTADGTYYIAVSGAVNTTGTYTVSVIVLGANGVSEADTDFPADNTTSGRVEVGASATGNIASTSDKDWFRVDLEAGKVYQIDLEGAATGRGSLLDPYLRLLDGSGNLIENHDDISTANLNSQLVFTPTAAGTYYLVVKTAGPTTGTYTLSVREIACTLNTGDIWCGVVTVGELRPSADALVGHGFADSTSLSAGGLAGYPDDTMFSVGDNDYTISGAYIQVPTADHLTGTMFVVLDKDLTDDDKAGLVLTVDNTTTTFAFSDASKGGTTGLYSWGQSGLDWSSTTTVTVRLPEPTTPDDPPDPDDFPADTTTTGQVEVGGSVTGNIESVGDADWFRVELEAGTRYQIDLEGAPTGRGTVSDPTINAVRDAGGNTITGTQNDDSGKGNNARTIFTAPADGAHYVVAAAYGSTGTYTLSVIVLGATGVSEADTDFPADNTTTGRVEVGASATGNIDAKDDRDGFRVDLEAGKTYQIDLEGADTSKGTLEDPHLSLNGDSFNVAHYISEDDDGGNGRNSRLTYTATTTGAYHLEVEGFTDNPGTYTLSVRDLATLDEEDEQGFVEGATDLPTNTNTSGVLVVDGLGARGAIYKPIHRPDNYHDFDTDWFAVELEAGRTYRIEMKGAILTSPGPNNYADPELTLRLPQINAIYDADGDYLLNTWGEDESSAHHLFRVTFHAHAGGTYYIAASGESFEWGGYELTVIDITEDTD